MCDYSLHSIKSRPAKVGDKLTTRDFGTGTRGFSASEDTSVAVCLRPGTELSFAGGITFSATGLSGWWHKAISHKTAIFRQINKERVSAHHDALEFPDGQIVLLTFCARVSKLRFFSYRRSHGPRLRSKPNDGPQLWVDWSRQLCGHSTCGWPLARSCI